MVKLSGNWMVYFCADQVSSMVETTHYERKVKRIMQVFTALIIILTVIAAIGTFVVGISPREENYGKKTKRNLTRLTLFYVISAILLVGIFLYFFQW